jgi:hypothetical protein
MSSSPSSCGMCDIRNIAKASEVWRSDCEEGLCKECLQQHSLAIPCRNHTTIPISGYRNLSYVLEISELCRDTTKSLIYTVKNTSVRVAEFAYWKITKTVRR